MKLERRSSFGWPATRAGFAPCKNGLVVHYDSINQGLASKSHSACRDYWKRTRVFHMGTRGWADIGYSWGCCPHGVIFEGRGWQRQQAAQPGGNSTWTSCTFMSGPSERPTAAQVAAFKELRAYLRAKGLAAAISYHSRFISTSCPGSILRGMVTSGALSGAPSGSPAPAPVSEEEPLLGLKRGDKGERVQALQEMIKAAGQGAALGESDGDYGGKTAEALRRVRLSVGSSAAAKAGAGDRVDAWTYQQLHSAVARNQSGKDLAKV